MFENRLRKNHKKLARWARREGVDCYRVYDADIPEYNVAVDMYADHVHVQEYAPPRSIEPARAEARLKDVLMVVPEVLGVAPERVHLKVRRRQVEGGQYGVREEPEARLTVEERGFRFEVELARHLDTGLFLDHRRLRELAASHCAGKRFLNLFAYTCTASVHAARADARETVNVDLSAAYLDWGQRNFRLNGLSPDRHRFERADCLSYLERERGRFGVIFLNPPSYSRSKAMRGDFEVRRDHGPLLDRAAERLEPGGVLFFSTHARGFELDPALTRRYDIREISAQSVPFDFTRSPHQAWTLRSR